MIAERIEFIGFPAVGSFVWCDSVKRPGWWSEIDYPRLASTDALKFNCALTVGRRYEVLGYEELPKEWKSGRFGGGYLLMLVEDDDGYVIGFDPERFHAVRS